MEELEAVLQNRQLAIRTKGLVRSPLLKHGYHETICTIKSGQHRRDNDVAEILALPDLLTASKLIAKKGEALKSGKSVRIPKAAFDNLTEVISNMGKEDI